MRVQDLMSRNVATCVIQDGLGYAQRLMRLRRVGALIVVDENGRAEGVVTRGDIELQRTRADWRDLRVWDVMGTPVHACRPEEDAERLRARMQALDIGHMPVLDARARLCGVVARGDLARALAAELRVEGPLGRGAELERHAERTRSVQPAAALPPAPVQGRMLV